MSAVTLLHHQVIAKTIPQIPFNSQEKVPESTYLPLMEIQSLRPWGFRNKENHSTCSRNEKHLLRPLWHLFEILKTAASSISLKLTPTEFYIQLMVSNSLECENTSMQGETGAVILFLGMTKKHRTSSKGSLLCEWTTLHGRKRCRYCPQDISLFDKSGDLTNSPISCQALKNSKDF